MLLKLYARWARWAELMQLDKSWLDYSNDGVMLSAGAEQYGDGVWHYTRALALASAASHENDGACVQQLLVINMPGSRQSSGAGWAVGAAFGRLRMCSHLLHNQRVFSCP
jgi:hypothetical protein